VDVARVVVAEDDLLIRELIAALIDVRRDLDLIGQAGTGADGARLVAALRPDWLITDYEHRRHGRR
jgi:YesN/AraC family two-component response regulator